MEAITFLILSTITNDGKYMVDFALRKILFGVSIQVSSKVRNAFFKAIRNWCDSHFLEFPQP
jgi:hypothetical protein